MGEEHTGQLSQEQSLPQLQVLCPEQPQLPLLTRLKMVDCMVSDVFEMDDFDSKQVIVWKKMKM